MAWVRQGTKYFTQEGYQDNGSTSYVETLLNHEIVPGRVSFYRFSNVGVPRGSTVQSIILGFFVTAKNYANVQSATGTVQYDLSPNSSRLVPGADARARSWSSTTPLTASWNTETPAGEKLFRNTSVSATQLNSMVSSANWSEASPITVAIAWQSVTSGNAMYLHGRLDGVQPYISVTYTPPGSSTTQTAVNMLENPSFTDGLANWEFNSFFGEFTQPTYTINASGGPAAPNGGNVLQVSSNGGKPVIMHQRLNDLYTGRWYMVSCYVYVPSATAGSVRLSILAQGVNTSWLTTKNQWVRLSFPYLYTNIAPFITVETNGVVPSGQKFYVANFQLTEHDVLRPYFDGNTVKAGGSFVWGSPHGVSASISPPPVVTTPVRQDDVPRHRDIKLNWNYSHPQGATQYSVKVLI